LQQAPRGHHRAVRWTGGPLVTGLLDAIVDALTEVLMQLLGLDNKKKGR